MAAEATQEGGAKQGASWEGPGRVRLAMSLPLIPQTAPQSVDLARELWDLGYSEAWLAEVGGIDAYALAAALATAVPDLRIGTAVVPAESRTPMAHAMAAATLSQLSGGRFVLGIGISSENIVAGWAGQPFDRPLDRMREHVQVLREVLDGEKVTYDGETLAVSRFRLATPPLGRVPIHMAALNRRMLRLAGRLADGVILNMVPENAMAQVLGEVRAGADEAGRDPSDIEVVARLHVVHTDDPEQGHNVVRAGFGAYVATSVYNRFFDWIGFSHEAELVRDAFARGDRAAVAEAMSDDLCDAVGIVGDTDTIRRRVRAYAEAGVDILALNPLLPNPEDQRNLFRALAGSLEGLDLPAGGVIRATS